MSDSLRLLWTVACQAPLSMGFSRQEYWRGLPCPPPEDLPNPGIKLASLMSPALAGGFFTSSAGKPKLQVRSCYSLHQNPQWLPSQIKKSLELSTRHPTSLVWSPPALSVPLWPYWPAGRSSEQPRCSPWCPDPGPMTSRLTSHLLEVCLEVTWPSFEHHSLSPHPTLDSFHPPDPTVPFSICER